MKKLKLKPSENETVVSFNTTEELLNKCSTKKEFVEEYKALLSNLAIEFYVCIGEILEYIGFKHVKVTRDGDVNCRFDATIIDKEQSIPIEIKSPRESKEINIKSITQACENKIILLSRKFYPTKLETTSLAIAFYYPPARSDVLELINDFNKTFNFNIGIINIEDLLNLLYDVRVNNMEINKDYLFHLNGKLNYEDVIIKK